MLIVDELLLLALDDTTGKSIASGTNLDAALGAALLVELALTERISIAPADAGWLERGKVTVINTSPTDDTDLDDLLAKLSVDSGDKKVIKARAKQLAEGDWAAKAVKDAIAELTAVMVAAAAGAGAGGGS